MTRDIKQKRAIKCKQWRLCVWPSSCDKLMNTHRMFGYGLSFGTGKYANWFCGWGSFFLNVDESEMGDVYTTFFFQLSFATTATTVVSGAIAERWDLCIVRELDLSFLSKWKEHDRNPRLSFFVQAIHTIEFQTNKTRKKNIKIRDPKISSRVLRGVRKLSTLGGGIFPIQWELEISPCEILDFKIFRNMQYNMYLWYCKNSIKICIKF